MVHAQTGAPRSPAHDRTLAVQGCGVLFAARVLARLEGLEPPILPVRSRVLCPLSYKR